MVTGSDNIDNRIQFHKKNTFETITLVNDIKK